MRLSEFDIPIPSPSKALDNLPRLLTFGNKGVFILWCNLFLG